jgi:hypothetical protein
MIQVWAIGCGLPRFYSLNFTSRVDWGTGNVGASPNSAVYTWPRVRVSLNLPVNNVELDLCDNFLDSL